MHSFKIQVVHSKRQREVEEGVITKKCMWLWCKVSASVSPVSRSWRGDFFFLHLHSSELYKCSPCLTLLLLWIMLLIRSSKEHNSKRVFLVSYSHLLSKVLVLFSSSSLIFCCFSSLRSFFWYYAACNLTAHTKLFQLLPKVFIRYRKSQFPTFCIFMAAFTFQNQQER